MLNTILGKKIGMTQIFDQDGKVVPVTAIDVANWIVTQVKTKENDGYSSLQLGFLRSKHQGTEFSPAWLKAKKNYFLKLKEVSVDQGEFVLGQKVDFDATILAEGQFVDVSARSRGLGFQGVVKRWSFGGGPAAHGSRFHRRPGSMGHMRSQGEVIKGKKLPGQHGNTLNTVQGLKIVRIDRDAACIFVKGSIPGKKDAVVVIRKQGK